MYNDNLIRPPALHSPGLGQGAQKGPEWAQNEQKLGKYVPKRELLVRYYQDLLSTGLRDIYNDNLTNSSRFGTYFLVFSHFEPIQALFEPPDPNQGYSKPGQIVNVYVPRACTKKSLESISPIILVLRHIFLVFGQRPRRGR